MIIIIGITIIITKNKMMSIIDDDDMKYLCGGWAWVGWLLTKGHALDSRDQARVGVPC